MCGGALAFGERNPCSAVLFKLALQEVSHDKIFIANVSCRRGGGAVRSISDIGWRTECAAADRARSYAGLLRFRERGVVAASEDHSAARCRCRRRNGREA